MTDVEIAKKQESLLLELMRAARNNNSAERAGKILADGQWEWVHDQILALRIEVSEAKFERANNQQTGASQ